MPLFMASCGEPSDPNSPIKIIPESDKIPLSGVSLTIKKAKLERKNDHLLTLSFRYTITNKSGYAISFPSIYPGKDHLIDVSLYDKNGDPINLGRRPLDDLTLASPRTMIISRGKFSRDYQLPIPYDIYSTLKKGDKVTLRVRFHAPSRYDELRSTIEAPLTTLTWPEMPTIEQLDSDIEDNPLTLPDSEATYPTR